MKAHQQFVSRMKDQRGVSAIIVAIVLGVLVGVAALAVDIGYVMATKNKLQNVADAAALAATRKLGALYQTMPYEEQQSYVCDANDIIPIALDVGDKNYAPGTITSGDVVIGVWDPNSKNLTPTLNQPDAVRVRAAREGGGAISTFFARIFGINSVDLWADATAALTGKSTAGPGEIELPVGISRYWFEENICNGEITFYPANDPKSCAGWTTFTHSPANDPTIQKIIQRLLENGKTVVNQTDFEFIGGTLSNPTFNELLNLFANRGHDLDAAGNPVPTGDSSAEPLYGEDGTTRLLYPDGTPRNVHEWETTIVVYDRDDCSNPNRAILILGFARVLVTDVLDAPDNKIKGLVLCNYTDMEDSRGGGGEFGVDSPIPNLVE